MLFATFFYGFYIFKLFSMFQKSFRTYTLERIYYNKFEQKSKYIFWVFDTKLNENKLDLYSYKLLVNNILGLLNLFY